MNTHLYTNTGIGTLYYFPKQLPQYTARQFYAKGGIATLVPRQHFLFGGLGKAITGGIGSLLGGVGDVGSAIVGGIGSAVGGLGDVLKSPIAQFALPFAAAALGIPPWAVPIANYAITGKINPLSVVSAALPGLQFAEGAEGLSLPTGWSDSTTGLNFGEQGTSLGNIVSDKVNNLFSGTPGDPLSNINSVQQTTGLNTNYTPPETITQQYLTSGSTGNFNPMGDFTGNNSITPSLSDRYLNVPTNAVDPNNLSKNFFTGSDISSPTTASQYQNVFTGAEDTTNPLTAGTGNKYVYDPATKQVVDTSAIKPGILQNLNTAFNPTNAASASDRLEALKDVGSSAFNAIYKNKDGSYNMSAVLATLVMFPTYAQAKAKADEIGVPFDEATYQAGKISPDKQKYASLAPKSSFGLKDGGRIEFGLGGMSDNRISQIIQLIRDAESVGDMEKANELRLDLYRETKKADGGRIGYEDGKLVLSEGPANKATRLQMEKAAKEAQKRYAKMKADEKLMEDNYKKVAPYESLVELKKLYDMAPEAGYPPMPEPVKPEGVLSIKLTPTQQKANGGKIVPRENHLFGSLVGKILSNDPNATPIGLFPNPNINEMSPVFKSPMIKQIFDQVVNPMQNPIQSAKQPYVPTNRPVNDLYQYYLNKENDEDKRKQIMSRVNPLFGIGKADGGMTDHPIRMLHGGIPELDLRAKGGFIPMGVKERADDVPAMLSKNEFVFTADAVRNAGGGSINKGAQKMYKLMKSLENKKFKKKAN